MNFGIEMEHTQTIDQILHIHEPELIYALIDAGVSHDKLREAFLCIHESVTVYIERELEEKRTENVLLVLAGFSENNGLMSRAILHYALTLNTRLKMEYIECMTISERILPVALKIIGDQLSWSILNQRGLERLITNTRYNKNKSQYKGVKRVLSMFTPMSN